MPSIPAGGPPDTVTPAPGFTLRAFAPSDYEQMAEVFTEAYQEYPMTALEIERRDEIREERCNHRRWVAVAGAPRASAGADSMGADPTGADSIIGVGEHDQFGWMYHPRKFSIDIVVRPAWQGRGVGRALYDEILGAIEPFEPISVMSMTRECLDRSVRFLADRGFVEAMRSWESRIDPASLDYDKYAARVDDVAAQGIRIASFRELRDDPTTIRKLHELQWAIIQDVPSTEPSTEIPLEDFARRLREDPNLLPDAFLVAIDGDRFVGMSALWSSLANDDLYTGLTGVIRSHRRRGIALALKIRTLKWARERGTRVVKTWNESNNRPMLSINEEVGFVRQPAWFHMRKVIRDE
jgi:GNAT superfamily N-acetyltransferase